MKPIGPLMTEHRLIERMVNAVRRQMHQMNGTPTVDAGFLRVAIDFFRTYVDRTHHGKEEDILFRELAKKKLSPKDGRIMNELIQEHAWARKMVTRLVEAYERYLAGQPGSIGQVLHCIEELTSFYPLHIAKEDADFFYQCLEYLSQQEQDQMLDEFREFDRKLIHRKYEEIVEEAELKRT